MEKVEFQRLPNGETMAYRRAGTGKDVFLLIHGNQSSSIFYEELLKWYAPSFTVVAIDLIGFGDSSYRRRHNTLGDFAEDVYLFLEEKKISKAAVLGWSTGGGVAMELAAMHPEKVERIFLMDSIGLTGFHFFRYDEKGRPLFNERLHSRTELVHDPVVFRPEAKALAEGDGEYFRHLWDQIMFHIRRPKEEQYEEYIGAILKQRCLLDVYTALSNFNITDKTEDSVPGNGHIKEIRCPVHIIHGAADPVVRVKKAKEMKKTFGEGATLNIIENAGHAVHLDRPEEFKRVLDSHLYQ